jgi:NAD(P)-dependent dehydrogenase (short-subunit alcohol dehydrogenase family)
LAGFGLVTALARRENVIVFAGARNPPAAAGLQALVQQYPGKVHIVKLTLCDKAENEAAVNTITTIAGRLDVVIACAGTFSYFLLFEFSKHDNFSHRHLPVLWSWSGDSR